VRRRHVLDVAASPSAPSAASCGAGQHLAAVADPQRAAMAAAVAGWSPVIITGVMPARRQAATAAADSGRGGSAMATSP
jgi:hypothetical protein